VLDTNSTIRPSTCVVESTLANKVRLSLEFVATIGMLLYRRIGVGIYARTYNQLGDIEHEA